MAFLFKKAAIYSGESDHLLLYSGILVHGWNSRTVAPYRKLVKRYNNCLETCRRYPQQE